jgi:hypothetical protein
MRILKLFGTDEGVSRVNDPRHRAGVLPGRPAPLLRPPRPHDLRRTLFGAKPPKGQELDDHYFGAIPQRVIAFMAEVERSSTASACRSRRGTTRSRRASTRSRRSSRTANVACDHQMLVMETLKRVAPRYGLAGPAAREAVRRRERLGQAQQLVALDRHGRQPARPARRDAHEHAVPGLPVRGHPRGRPPRRPAPRLDRQRRQRPPPRRQRGAARDHLDLPGRHAHRHHRAAREGHAEAHAQGRGSWTSAR